ncbi:response regulator [Rhizobium sp. Root1220]|uniref:response regulator transcription factor n=1 Tax=Rhizobium sp. Root1220 TaxID=1736432 RepID=UPI0009E8B2AA|nr:response regulator [Rhizobium sp. Root1220]
MDNFGNRVPDRRLSDARLASSCNHNASRQSSARSETTPVVVIIEDNDAIREALQELLQSVNFRCELYRSVDDFDQRYDQGKTPSCYVLDIRLPGLSGLDFHEQLVANGSKVPAIFMTAHADVQLTVRAMKAGAIDFLVKPFREQEFLDVVAKAINLDRGRRNAAEALDSVHSRVLRLTKREREVMPLVAAGKMNKQIAGHLGISETTVKVHRGSIMRKLSVRTVADLVRISDVIARAPNIAASSDRPVHLAQQATLDVF